jgi:hypothetical protein
MTPVVAASVYTANVESALKAQEAFVSAVSNVALFEEKRDADGHPVKVPVNSLTYT